MGLCLVNDDHAWKLSFYVLRPVTGNGNQIKHCESTCTGERTNISGLPILL